MYIQRYTRTPGIGYTELERSLFSPRSGYMVLPYTWRSEADVTVLSSRLSLSFKEACSMSYMFDVHSRSKFRTEANSNAVMFCGFFLLIKSRLNVWRFGGIFVCHHLFHAKNFVLYFLLWTNDFYGLTKGFYFYSWSGNFKIPLFSLLYVGALIPTRAHFL